MTPFSKKYILFFIFLITSHYLYYNGYAQNSPSKKTIGRCGDGLQILLPASAFIYSHYTQDTAGKEQFIQSFFLNLIITYGLKISINKKRPNGDLWSFPSAHTSVSFQAAAFIQKRYGWEYGFFAYLGAVFVGFSRIYAEKHYFKDVAAGALLGIGCSYLLTKKYAVIEINKFSIHFSLKL
jgi:membrane-associated phospholipid phosphatase